MDVMTGAEDDRCTHVPVAGAWQPTGPPRYDVRQNAIRCAPRARTGMNTWRAGCGGSRTSGSEGGLEKPTAERRQGAPVRPLHLHSDPGGGLHLHSDPGGGNSSSPGSRSTGGKLCLDGAVGDRNIVGSAEVQHRFANARSTTRCRDPRPVAVASALRSCSRKFLRLPCSVSAVQSPLSWCLAARVQTCVPESAPSSRTRTEPEASARRYSENTALRPLGERHRTNDAHLSGCRRLCRWRPSCAACSWSPAWPQRPGVSAGAP